MGKQIGSNKAGKKKINQEAMVLCFQHPQNLSAVFIALACVLEGSFYIYMARMRVCVC